MLLIRACRRGGFTLIMVGGALLGGCSSARDATAPGSTATSALPGVPHETISPIPSGGNQAPSPEAARIIDRTGGALALSEIEARCLGQRLDQDAGLRAALSGNPQESPRWSEVASLAQECIRTTTAAAEFANGIQAQAPGLLTTGQQVCLRDAYARLSAQESARIMEAAFKRDGTDPTAEQLFEGLFTGCGIDVQKLPRPSRP